MERSHARQLRARIHRLLTLKVVSFPSVKQTSNNATRKIIIGNNYFLTRIYESNPIDDFRSGRERLLSFTSS